MTALLLLCVLLPLAPAALLGARLRGRSGLLALAPWTALPALLLAAWGPSVSGVEVTYVLLGMRLGLDATGRVFLFFTALLWLLAGVYARSYLADDPARGRFFVFYLLSMSGNLGLTVAHDLATFLLFFSLMTLSAYGLIVHEGGEAARRAGRVYIVLAVAGEGMLLAGALVAADSAPGLAAAEVAAGVAASPLREVAVALLLAGFGVKAGILPLHVWLPLAHPVAPTPASAVLSGSMIKAGLLGWLRFLPLGEAALPGWGGVVVLLGLGAAFFGAAAGVLQDDPKTTLAYSSISQMGVVSVAVGVALADPALRGVAGGAVLVYALHHALVKGALFLGVGVAAARPASLRERRLVAAGVLFAALAMAGAPLTSGSLVKHALKEAVHRAPGEWARWLDVLVPLTAVATSLLMTRFVWLVLLRPGAAARGRLAPGLWLPWSALLLAVAVVLWAVPPYPALGLAPPGLPGPGALWSSTWPILLAGALTAAAVAAARRAGGGAGGLRLPAGDLLLPVERLAVRVRRMAGGRSWGPPPDPAGWLAANWYDVYAHRERWGALLRQELRLTRWGTAGTLFLLAAVFLFLLLLAGRVHAP